MCGDEGENLLERSEYFARNDVLLITAGFFTGLLYGLMVFLGLDLTVTYYDIDNRTTDN